MEARVYRLLVNLKRIDQCFDVSTIIDDHWIILNRTVSLFFYSFIFTSPSLFSTEISHSRIFLSLHRSFFVCFISSRKRKKKKDNTNRIIHLFEIIHFPRQNLFDDLPIEYQIPKEKLTDQLTNPFPTIFSSRIINTKLHHPCATKILINERIAKHDSRNTKTKNARVKVIHPGQYYFPSMFIN